MIAKKSLSRNYRYKSRICNISKSCVSDRSIIIKETKNYYIILERDLIHTVSKRNKRSLRLFMSCAAMRRYTTDGKITLSQMRELKRVNEQYNRGEFFSIGTIIQLLKFGATDNFVKRLRYLANVKASKSRYFYIGILGYTEGTRYFTENNSFINNNPGRGHGGKYSSLSMSFFKYEGLNDEEKSIEINKVLSTIKQVKRDHPEKRGNMNVAYWTGRGHTENEAIEIIKKRAATFSLKSCIEKHGDIEGLAIFNDRQERWQNTLKSKSPEEIERINRSKVHASPASRLSDLPGILYYIKFFNDDISFWKIGITSKTVEQRFGSRDIFKNKYNLDYEIIDTVNMRYADCFYKEQEILERFGKHRVRVEYNGFHTTESFNTNVITERLSDV